MTITDISFLLYLLPAVLVIYFALFFSQRAQNIWLAISCFLFYAFANIGFLLLAIFLVFMNYLSGYAIHKWLGENMEDYEPRDEYPRQIKPLVYLAIALNILPLFFYRYLPFYIESLSISFKLEIALPEFLIPLGLSFIALHGISYIIDIAKGYSSWLPSFAKTAIYLLFFPVLTAGPILRFHDMELQLKTREITFDKVATGLSRFVIGLAKVVLIATPLMRVADLVFGESTSSGLYSTVPISLAVLGLISQLVAFYHTLSGYSDMAIGLGQILGFTIPENFNYPIIASSLTIFWKRCYISLTSWFEEYIYTPLEKRRKNSDHMVRHLFYMWILIGLWWGPGVVKLIACLFNFMVILLERVTRVSVVPSKNPFRHVYVILTVIITIVALRSDTIYQLTNFFTNLFGMKNNGFFSAYAFDLFLEVWPMLLVGFVLCFPLGLKFRQFVEVRDGQFIGYLYSILYPVAMIALALLILIVIATGSYNPGQFIKIHLWS